MPCLRELYVAAKNDWTWKLVAPLAIASRQLQTLELCRTTDDEAGIRQICHWASDKVQWHGTELQFQCGYWSFGFAGPFKLQMLWDSNEWIMTTFIPGILSGLSQEHRLSIDRIVVAGFHHQDRFPYLLSTVIPRLPNISLVFVNDILSSSVLQDVLVMEPAIFVNLRALFLPATHDHRDLADVRVSHLRARGWDIHFLAGAERCIVWRAEGRLPLEVDGETASDFEDVPNDMCVRLQLSDHQADTHALSHRIEAMESKRRIPFDTVHHAEYALF